VLTRAACPAMFYAYVITNRLGAEATAAATAAAAEAHPNDPAKQRAAVAAWSELSRQRIEAAFTERLQHLYRLLAAAKRAGGRVNAPATAVPTAVSTAVSTAIPADNVPAPTKNSPPPAPPAPSSPVKETPQRSPVRTDDSGAVVDVMSPPPIHSAAVAAAAAAVAAAQLNGTALGSTSTTGDSSGVTADKHTATAAAPAASSGSGNSSGSSSGVHATLAKKLKNKASTDASTAGSVAAAATAWCANGGDGDKTYWTVFGILAQLEV
jgi:hypothetical protein